MRRRRQSRPTATSPPPPEVIQRAAAAEWGGELLPGQQLLGNYAKTQLPLAAGPEQSDHLCKVKGVLSFRTWKLLHGSDREK